jgi:hypothetical protein
VSIHGNSVQQDAGSVRTNDTRPAAARLHPFAPKYATQKEELRESPLAPLCLESLERLVDYSQHLHREAVYADDDLREVHSLERPGPLDVTGLETAAEQVLRCVQIKLAELENTDLEAGTMWALVHTQRLARQAHFEPHGSQARVKEVELKAANGLPLAICTGTGFKYTLPSPAAEVLNRSQIESAAPGCHRIFRDTTHATGGGTYWRNWCPDCAPETGQRVRYWRRTISRRWIDYADEILKRRPESA